MALGGEFKKTECGLIPKDWGVCSIGQSMQLLNGRAFKPKEWSNRGLPIIRIQNLNSSTSDFNYFSGKIDDRHKVEPGDLLFAWSGTTGTSFGARIWPGPSGVLNQHIFKVLPSSKKITHSFAYLALRKVQEQIEKHAHGFKASFVHVKKSDLVKVSLPLPPSIKEQECIAEVLHDTTLYIEATEKLIVKKRNIKQATMQQLLTGKTRLPGFSGKWEEKKLSEISKINPQALGSETSRSYCFKYISLEDVDCGLLRNYSDQKFSTAPSRARRILKNRDVLISNVRPNLKSHLLFAEETGDWICSTGFSVVRCDISKANSEFVFHHLFSGSISKQIDALVTGSNYPSLNSSDVRNLTLPCPRVEEQIAIANLLSSMSEEIRSLEKKLSKLKLVRQGMMQELLTGRIRLV